MISESHRAYLEKRIRAAQRLFPLPTSGTDAEIDAAYFRQAEVVSPGGVIKISQLISEGVSPDAIAELETAAGAPAALVEIWRSAGRHIVSNGAAQVAPAN